MTERQRSCAMPDAKSRTRLALVSCILVLAVWYGFFLDDARFYDLVPTYFAGELWLGGQVGSVYQPEIWPAPGTGDPQWQETIARHGYAGFQNSYVYHPIYLLLWLPFVAALSLSAFTSLFVFFNAVSLVFIVDDVLDRIGEHRALLRPGLTFALAWCYPVYYSVQLGQNVMIGLAVVLLALRAFDARRPLPAFLLFLFAMAAKPWFVLLLGIFPFAGQLGRGLALAAAYAAVSIGLAGSLLPSAMVADWSAVLERIPNVSILAFNNISIRAFVHRLSLPDWPAHLLSWRPLEVSAANRVVELIVIGALGLASAYGLYRQRGRRLVWIAGAPLILLPLGVVWDHYVVMGIPLLLAGLFGRVTTGLRVLFVIAAVLFALPVPRVFSSLFGREQLGLILFSLELPLIAMATMAFALLWAGDEPGDYEPGNDETAP